MFTDSRQEMESTRSTAPCNLRPYEDESDLQVCLTQNSVVQITLSGPALVLTILAIIAAVQILRPSYTCTLIALAPLPWIIYNEYATDLVSRHLWNLFAKTDV